MVVKAGYYHLSCNRVCLFLLAVVFRGVEFSLRDGCKSIPHATGPSVGLQKHMFGLKNASSENNGTVMSHGGDRGCFNIPAC